MDDDKDTDDKIEEEKTEEKKPPVWLIQDTTRDAYESVNRGDDSWYRQVLGALEEAPSTCDELEITLQGRHQTISSRIRKGVQDGYIKNTGQKRPTRTGRKAIIWERMI
jgi:predicted HTH transcriptional regulator